MSEARGRHVKRLGVGLHATAPTPHMRARLPVAYNRRSRQPQQGAHRDHLLGGGVLSIVGRFVAVCQHADGDGAQEAQHRRGHGKLLLLLVQRAGACRARHGTGAPLLFGGDVRSECRACGAVLLLLEGGRVRAHRGRLLSSATAAVREQRQGSRVWAAASGVSPVGTQDLRRTEHQGIVRVF